MPLESQCPRLALRCSRSVCLNAARPFSSSARRSKNVGLPVFTEASSPELTAALLEFRMKKMVPAYLNNEQRKLIYRQKHRSRLENETVTATIGDEEVELEHIERTKDVPNSWEIFRRIVSLSKEPQDWRNVVTVAQGFHNGRGTHFPARWQALVVRKLLENGHVAIMLEALRRVEVTGISMGNQEVMDVLIPGLSKLAGETPEAAEEEQVERALKAAEEVVALMEHELHCGGRKLAPNDFRLRPSSLGVCLEMAAIRASKFQGGQDVDGKLRLYLDRVIGMWEQGAKDAPYATLLGSPESKTKIDKSAFVRTWQPVLTGLELAQEVLGQDVGQAAVEAHKTIQERVRAAE